MRSAVFDTSALLGAVLQPGSLPYRALAEALATMDVCASVHTLHELQEVLRRRKFDRWLSLERRRQFFDILAASVVLHAVTQQDEAAAAGQCRDPQDDKFLALALACGAEVVVTSDSDLLVLDPWRGIRVLKPADFLRWREVPPG